MLSFLSLLCVITPAFYAWSSEECGLNPDGSHTCPQFIGYSSKEEYHSMYGETATMGTRVNLTDAMNNNGAACLDGTVPVFYWRPGTGDGVNKFHVFFEGGGWCAGVNTAIAACMDTCAHRATDHLGSSLTYTPTANYDNGYMSTNQTTNPLSYNWNTVYVKYCDGASFSGNNDTTETAGKYTLHWRGWRNLNGAFAELKAKYNFDKATDVLMSGCSAGGLTTWLHSDYVYDTYVKPLGANFLSMPDSGFFMEYEGAGKYISGLNWNYQWQNTSDAMNRECMSAHKTTNDENLCIFAQETAPYVHVRMFPLQSRYDSWQTGQELRSSNATLINEYGANMTKVFEANYINNAKYGADHAAFFDSCHHHCGEWNAITMDGMKSSQAQFEWYYKNNTHNKYWNQNTQSYPCSSCCT